MSETSVFRSLDDERYFSSEKRCSSSDDTEHVECPKPVYRKKEPKKCKKKPCKKESSECPESEECVTETETKCDSTNETAETKCDEPEVCEEEKYEVCEEEDYCEENCDNGCWWKALILFGLTVLVILILLIIFSYYL